jgi:hypothetical protein
MRVVEGSLGHSPKVREREEGSRSGYNESLGEEAVLADSGRAGEKSGLFKHPVGLFFCGDTVEFPKPAYGIGH